MYYSDHLAVSKTELGSRNLCTLVDVAVMLYEEEEEEHRLMKSKEESYKRIFHLFPRKTRSSLMTFRRRNPQQIHVVSTSSSHLLDLNSIPTTYSNTAHQLFSSSLGHYKTKSQQNPNSPSSCLTEMTNPNSLKTEKTSGLKRRAAQEIKRNGKSKKAKVSPLSWKGKETPEMLLHLMSDVNGADPRLIFEKTLSETDCDPAQSRLLMPFNSLIRNDFLTLVESSILEDEHGINNNDDNLGVGSILVDQRGVKWGVIFKRRDMKKKDSGKVNLNYALICGWSDMVKANGLKDGDSISVWSFRLGGLLCFAIVSPPAMAQT